MTKAELIADPNSCLNRSADDEPVFLLCGRDKFAPEIIDEWAFRASLRGSPIEKTTTAARDAEAMRAWQEVHGSKIPD